MAKQQTPWIWLPAGLATAFADDLECTARFVEMAIGAVDKPGPVPGRVSIPADQEAFFEKFAAAGFVVIDAQRRIATIVDFNIYRDGPEQGGV
jgi:hypothetical protein